MRRSQRLIAATVLVALSGALAGCCGGMSNFDPTDMLDFLDTKKKLPGERKPVFPEGVPGLEQGVPKDLYKGARSSRSTSRTPAAAAAAAAAGGAEVEACREIQGQASRPPPRRAGPRPMPMPRPRKRAHRRGAAAAQAAEDRAQAHHGAAARSAGAAAAHSPRQPSSNPRHSRRRCRAALSRADFYLFIRIARPFAKQGAWIAHVLHDCHYRPAQCRKVDAVQPAGWAEARAGR